jgi:hypothetical protein
MKDYSKGKIYKLVSPLGLVYIGSTCEPTLARRKTKHKSDYKTWKKGKKGYITSFKLYDEDDDNVDIVLIEKYPCETKDELHKRERYFIETVECVNKNLPSRSKQECDHAYYENNKEELKQYQKDYRKNNEAKVKERQKKYRDSDEVKQKQAKYHKAYSLKQENIDRRNQRLSQKETCCCGSTYRLDNKCHHTKTGKHQKYINSMQPLVNIYNGIKQLLSKYK